MIFEDASSADASELAALVNAAYRRPGSTPGWTDERHLLKGDRTDEAMVRDDIASGRVLVARAARTSRISACVSIAAEDDESWSLSSIAVDPAVQAAGLGAALLGEVERQARSAGRLRLRMTVIQLREPLIAWYERRGFRRTGAVKPFPYHDRRVGRPLRDDLSLVVLEKLV